MEEYARARRALHMVDSQLPHRLLGSPARLASSIREPQGNPITPLTFRFPSNSEK
jgi:hypothetical protein